MMTQICEAKVLCCERYVSNKLAIEWNKTHVKRLSVSLLCSSFIYKVFFTANMQKVHLTHCRGRHCRDTVVFFFLII